MMIWASKGVVLFKLKNSERILNIIPTARTFKVKGEVLTAVPHKIDETKKTSCN